MAAKLQSGFNAQVELIEGSGGIFDVVVDGSKIFSKHQTGDFPNEDNLVATLSA